MLLLLACHADDDALLVGPFQPISLHTTPATTLDGQVDSLFGYAVAGIGDVDGDGYDDVAVGAAVANGGSGQATVFHGAATGIDPTPAETMDGETTYDRFGEALCGGDINGDGFGDLVVGASGRDDEHGRIYVYLGSASGLTLATTIDGENAYDTYGISVATSDVNGDGFDEVIVGAFQYNAVTGRAYVYAGSAAGLATTASAVLDGESSPSEFAFRLDAAGDVNGDGFGDVIVGAHRYNDYQGRAYLYAGSAAGLSTTPLTTLTGAAADQFGYSVAGAGDVDGDGYDDVVVGGYDYTTYQGQVRFYRGSVSGLVSTAAATLTGEATANAFSDGLAGAGDVDADGFADVVIGAPLGDRVYLHAGSPTGLGETAVVTLEGEADGDFFGVSVDAAGDVNGDGFGDVIVGAYAHADNAGRAYLFTGYADADADGHEAGADCDDADAAVNPDATEVCDAANADEDCDGLADDADDSADAAGKVSAYVDADGDGYGSTTPATVCDASDGYSATADDCDDTNADAHPGAQEVPNDDVDQDCNGVDLTDTSDAGEPADTAGSQATEDPGCACGGGAPAAPLALFIPLAAAARRKR